MSQTYALPTPGTKFEISADGGATYTEFCVKRFATPKSEPERMEITDSCSKDGYRAYMDGLKDPGQLETTLNLKMPEFQQLHGYAKDRTVLRFRQTYPIDKDAGHTSATSHSWTGTISVDVPDTEVGSGAFELTMRTTVRSVDEPVWGA